MGKFSRGQVKLSGIRSRPNISVRSTDRVQATIAQLQLNFALNQENVCKTMSRKD
jgi:hypothetical protein